MSSIQTVRLLWYIRKSLLLRLLIYVTVRCRESYREYLAMTYKSDSESWLASLQRVFWERRTDEKSETAVASPIDNTWQWHLNVTMSPGELARNECSERGGLTRTLRLYNFLILLWTSRCAYKNTETKYLSSVEHNHLLSSFIKTWDPTEWIYLRYILLYFEILCL